MHARSYCEDAVATEMEKKKSFLNYNANLTSVITMELKFGFAFSFKFWLHSCSPTLSMNNA